MMIYEVGVGPVWSCRSKPYWIDNATARDKCVLFEPLFSYYEEIKNAISKYPNVELHNIVIYDYNGQCDFIENGQLSYIQGLNSPYVQFGGSHNITKSICCARISEFDKGDIDLLLLDMEGADWFALKHLISRPQTIIIETQCSIYHNPFLNEIQEWMQINKYRQIDKVGADSVWEKIH